MLQKLMITLLAILALGSILASPALAADKLPPPVSSTQTTQTAPVPKPLAAPAPVGTVVQNPIVDGCFNSRPCDNPRGHFYADLTLSLLVPKWGSNEAFETRTFNLGLEATATENVRDFNYPLSASPLVVLGYTSADGVGIRGRWFRFDQEKSLEYANTVSGALGAINTQVSLPGGLLTLGDWPEWGATYTDSYTFQNRLLLDVIDLEATSEWANCSWSLVLGAGVRYLHLTQQYRTAAARNFPPGTAPVEGTFAIDATAVAGRTFDVIGPTLSIDVTRQLGKRGLALYCDVRGAVLFGSEREASLNIIAEATSPDGTTINRLATESAYSSIKHYPVLPVLETEIGLQYKAQLGRLEPFLRAGLVGQCYFGAGSATGGGFAHQVAAVPYVDRATNLGLFGLNITLGTRF